MRATQTAARAKGESGAQRPALTYSWSVPRFLVVVLSLVLIGPCAAQNASGTEPVRGLLAWQAQKAHTEGKSAVTLGPTILEYPGPEPLETALVHSSVIIATLLESKTTHDQREIQTWRKYRIIEWLSRQSRELPPERDQNWLATLNTAPKSMLPLAGDEFLMEDYGGTVTVDGVTITITGDGTQELPVGGRYLMFVIFGSAREIAGANYGPASLFTIDDSDTLHARFPKLDSNRNSLLHEIRQRANGTLSGLRSLAATVANSNNSR